MKWIQYTLEGVPATINVAFVLKFFYKREMIGDYEHRLCYEPSMGGSSRIIFYSKTKEKAFEIYQKLLLFLVNSDMPIMIIDESEGDKEATMPVNDFRRLEVTG